MWIWKEYEEKNLILILREKKEKNIKIEQYK